MNLFRCVRIVLPATFLLALAGCSIGPKYQPPAVSAPAVYKETPGEFEETGGWKVAQPSDAMLRGKWWEIFKDPELNAMEEQLNVDNQNIKQSFEDFMQARALVREARSQYFPSAAATPSFNRSRSSGSVKQLRVIASGYLLGALIRRLRADAVFRLNIGAS